MLNRFKTVALLGLLTTLFLFIGQLFGGTFGLVIATILAFTMNFGAYWFSDKIVLKMYKAQEVTANEVPELYQMVKTLSERAELPMPKVYIIPEQTPNAFATGRNPKNAAVAVTVGIMELLNREELFGVLAHEIGHIKNRDTLVMTVAGAIGGAISFIADMAFFSALFGGSDEEDNGSLVGGLLGLMIAPFAAMIIQMAISRSREFVADETGAILTGNPLALASALRKIEGWSKEVPIHSGTPATAHLFIINPFAGGGLGKLFSTHPATTERIKRLEALDTTYSLTKLELATN